MPKFVCESFATPADLLAVICEGDLDPVADAALIQSALDDAADALYILSGQRFYGLCTTVMRPCGDNCMSTPCGCCELQVVPLSFNFHELISVKIDGATLDPSEYRVGAPWPAGMPSLIRLSLDGTRPTRWPGCQRLDLPLTADNTFGIEYVHGHTPGVTEINANVEVALGIIASAPGRNINMVPGASSISGGGVVIVNDPTDEAQTVSIPSVRRFLAVWNPREDRSYSAVWSPEMGVR